MKNMKKIIAVLMSLTAIAMSTSAFAEVDANGTATYNGDADNASVKYETTTLDGVADKQLTVVIVPTNLGEEGITSGNIYYINQATAGKEFTDIIADMKVKDGFEFAENKYEVRIGGVLADDYYSCVVTGEELETILYGDVNGDTKGPNAADKAFLARYLAKWPDYQDGAKNAINRLNADVNKPDGKGTTINAADKATLNRYLAKWPDYLVLPKN